MTKFILAFVCCIFYVQSASAAKVTVEDARRRLGQWGVSYCIARYSEHDSTQGLGAVAQGGYFQLGFHDDWEADKAVQKYVDRTMKQNNGSKVQQSSRLVQCIDMYEDPKFEELIRRLDKYFDQKRWDNVDDAWIRL